MSDFLLTPLTWLAGAALLLVLGRRLHRNVKRSCQAIVLLAILACTPLFANALLWLAERHPAIADCTTGQDDWPIVLLTAGFERPPRSVDDDAALARENFVRMDVARGLVLASEHSILHVSGGGKEHIAEAAVVSHLLEERGIPAERMRLETRSRTTWENAFQLRSEVQRVRLVTSRAHLQRAAIAFHAAGIDACAGPAISGVVEADGAGYVLPRRTALTKTEQALHELVGRIVYAWRAYRVHAASNRS